MADSISVRPIETLEQARTAAELLDRVWGEQRVIGTPLLWAMASHGGQVMGAFHDEELVGAQVGVVGVVDGRLTLHSHITGVLSELRHQGIGLMLKTAQRDWCLERGIDRITWTFDPMVARNAYFNLVKLGAVAVRFHRKYYGEMQDAFNRGDRSDRLEVLWELESERARAALGEVAVSGPGRNIVVHAMVGDVDGRPAPATEPLRPGEQLVSISVPAEYHELRRRDSDLARTWRDAVGDALEEADRLGYRPTRFVKEGGHRYVLERR